MAGITDLLVPKYYEPWNAFVTRDAREFWLTGGRGSLKSTFAGYLITLGVMANPGVSAMVVRKHKEDIRSSVYNQIAWCIEKLDEIMPEQRIRSRWRFLTNPSVMIFDNDRAIVYHGLDDPRKRKSAKPPKGKYFGYLWCEELDEFAGMKDIRSLKKSVLRGGELGQALFTFNPPQSTAAWVNAEAARRKKGRVRYHTTYLDILPYHPEWLGETFLEDAEDLKKENEQQYRYELLGEATGTGGEIFTNVHEEPITDEQIANFRDVGYGLDFGFENDPTALTESAYDSDTRTLYIFGEWVKHGQYTEDIYRAIQERGLTDAVIIADSAEPRTIAELNRLGARKMRKCYKAPGWVEDGLRFMRFHIQRIVIDSRRCPVAFKEFTGYEYGRYANGEFRTDYPDKNNHTIDSVRMRLEQRIRDGVAKRTMAMPRALNTRR